jgi:glycosyltransferase involved in cell wall biosynthesis
VSQPLVSVVVISYNMPRELPRTVASLSPAMQRGIAADDYEVIVVDNGSTRPFDPAACQATGAPLKILQLPAGDPSPCRAINHGLALARGKLVGVMIDGARMASPGLLAMAAMAARLHHRPVVSTLGFHLGPEVQMESVKRGYNQEEEDRLLASVDWMADGYRLFDISVFAGSSSGGWFEPIAESNALFLAPALWRELGGFDERFRSPGGGLVNLDTYARACDLPDSLLVTLLGEGSFHQVHGGVATNAEVHPFPEFLREYVAIRGRDYARPDRPSVYLGSADRHALPSVARSATATADRLAASASSGG